MPAALTTTRLRALRSTPVASALAAALLGAVNVAAALRPDLSWRGHLLLEVEPVQAVRLLHAFALPAGAALLLLAPYLYKGRHRAWQAAVVLMVVLGVLDILKGPDLISALITWGVAAMLARRGDAFGVRHDGITARSALWRVPALGVAALALTTLAAWISQHRPSWTSVVRETGNLLAWRSGPSVFHHHLQHLAWLPDSVHLLELGTLAAIAYVVFRPLAGPRGLPDDHSREAAAEIVRAHGSDTLSFFKLRSDQHYFFNAARTAFVGYRVENGVLLLAGDPVGPDGAIAGLLDELSLCAGSRGLKLGVVGASAEMCARYEARGLRTIYLGDEAIVDVQQFTLQGRPIRKVRQSVSRLEKAGYTAELLDVSALGSQTADEIEQVLELGREGAPERGFSMAMESICGAYNRDTLALLARDGDGAIRGVLQFVPCYGRAAMSLSFMRRDPDTPNGLTEFMVVRAIEALRERGVAEMSLNFAAFAKWIHSPATQLESALGKLIALGNPYFQIESLYRFNAKFFPRWEPRYLVYEGALGLPRTSLAAMWAEGQLPKPALPEARSPRTARRAVPAGVR
jgi:lysyl-tRNA synthetase, class II